MSSIIGMIAVVYIFNTIMMGIITIHNMIEGNFRSRKIIRHVIYGWIFPPHNIIYAIKTIYEKYKNLPEDH